MKQSVNRYDYQSKYGPFSSTNKNKTKQEIKDYETFYKNNNLLVIESLKRVNAIMKDKHLK
jgi:hypothetical protein